MEPSAAIAIIENDLRHLVNAVMQRERGAQWLTAIFSAEDIQGFEARKEEEAKRRAPAHVPEQLLAYAHFYQLRKVIEKNWQLFAPALGEKKEFSVLSDKIEDFRNAPAHSRELLHHERALLEGIAGTIRTAVTRYLSTMSPDAKHYPVIEWIRDSFGNEGEDLSQFMPIVRTGIRLRVGDEVLFDAKGWDPQGRQLTWSVDTLPRSEGDAVSVVGSDVTFTLKVGDECVGERLLVEVSLASDGRYHRHQHYDQRVTYFYSVDPPEDGVAERVT